MTLKYYHAEPAANSLKSMIPLLEKGLPYQSIYVDLHKFEQHADWFVAINPEGQVPVLDHDGVIITHTTVINEYLEDVFPEVPLRPRDPVGAARMRYWNKFCDEQVMNYVSMHGWHRMVGIIARKLESGEFERLMENIPLPGPAHEVAHGALRIQREGPRARDREDRLRGGQGGEAARAQRLDRRRRLHARRHQLLFLLRHDGGTHVSGTEHRHTLPAPGGVAREDERATGRGARARGGGSHRPGPAHLDGARAMSAAAKMRAWQLPAGCTSVEQLEPARGAAAGAGARGGAGARTRHLAQLPRSGHRQGALFRRRHQGGGRAAVRWCGDRRSRRCGRHGVRRRRPRRRLLLPGLARGTADSAAGRCTRLSACRGDACRVRGTAGNGRGAARRAR